MLVLAIPPAAGDPLLPSKSIKGAGEGGRSPGPAALGLLCIETGTLRRPKGGLPLPPCTNDPPEPTGLLRPWGGLSGGGPMLPLAAPATPTYIDCVARDPILLLLPVPAVQLAPLGDTRVPAAPAAAASFRLLLLRLLRVRRVLFAASASAAAASASRSSSSSLSKRADGSNTDTTFSAKASRGLNCWREPVRLAESSADTVGWSANGGGRVHDLMSG